MKQKECQAEGTGNRLEDTDREKLEPVIQIRLRDSEQESSMSDLDTSQENHPAQPSSQDKKEQRNTYPEPEPESETPVPLTN